MWDSVKISEILEGNLYGSSRATFNGCAIDSRKVTPGELFVAIRGENTDGHKYIANAFSAGASLIIAEADKLHEYGQPEVPEDKALIVVQDTPTALQALAKAYIKEINPLVVSITGSSGKTTTKDMVAAVLAQKYLVHKNSENHNNEIGLPLTILTAPQRTEVMVLEMGMRGLGQIDALCAIGNPSIGVITNIGTTHMELLGSQENIAKAKWELINNLPENGTAILNAEDYYSVKQAENTSIKKIFYGMKGEYIKPDIAASSLQPVGSLETRFTVTYGNLSSEVNLPLPGEHNVLDALAALAVGSVCGVSLAQGALALEEFKLSKMRLEILKGISNSIIINDVYNANPSSMKASLKVLSERGGARTIAILGEMYELGDTSISGHREVGQLAAELGLGELISVGRMAEDIAKGAIDSGMDRKRVHSCKSCEEAAELAKQILICAEPEMLILVKGSRGMKMEKISDRLQVL